MSIVVVDTDVISFLTLGVPLVTNNAADYAGVDGLMVLTAATP
jgi:hypothetical protein